MRRLLLFLNFWLMTIASCTQLPLQAAWGGGGCPSGGCFPGPVGPSVETYHWYKSKVRKGCYSLYLDNQQVGWLDPDHGYRSFDGLEFGPVEDPPIPAPVSVHRDKPCGCCKDCTCEPCTCKDDGKPCVDGCQCVPKPEKKAAEPPSMPAPPPTSLPQPAQNYGIILDRMHPEGEQCLLNGQPASKQQLYEAIKGEVIDDDSKMLRLTVIGSDPERKQVMDDLHSSPALKALGNQYLVQDYPPSHWSVAQSGFVTTGHPTIYLQDASGKVLHRQDDYKGADDLANALRKADPHYDASKDADLRKEIDTMKTLKAVPLWAWVLGAFLLLLLLKGRI